MQSAMAGVPAIGCHEAMRALAFRMLSVAACSSHHLIWHMAAGSPVALFRTLRHGEDGLLAMPHCLFDELTTTVLALYHNQLESEECSEVLRTLAQHFHLDILDLERNHATIRRAIQSKSIQTWTTTFDTLCAHWVLRRAALLRRPFARKVLKQAKCRKKPRRQVQGGGPWRAFMHLRSKSGGVPWTKSFMLRMKQTYHALKATPDFAMFRDLGMLGHMASRAGKRAFSKPARKRSASRMPGMPGDHGANAEDPVSMLQDSLEAQLTALRSESRQLTIQNKREEESAQEAIASTSDALAPVHEAEGVAKHTQISEKLGSAFVFSPGKPSVAQFHVPADRFVQDSCGVTD